MQPMRIGTAGRELFATFHPAAGATARAEAVLICNPFGQEGLRAHRMLKVVADRLSRSGYATLRFDYYGSGDSDGETTEFSCFSAQRDVAVAHAHLARLSGAKRFVWIGLRLGANVAMAASHALQSPLAALLLWDALEEGPGYLAQLESSHIAFMEVNLQTRWAQLVRETGRPERLQDQALGFPLTPGLLAELRALDMKAVPSPNAAHAFWLSDSAPHTQHQWLDPQWLPVPPRDSWNSDLNIASGTVPSEYPRTIQQTLERLS